MPVHSGMAGGALPDAAIALNVILGRLYWDNGPLPIPGFYDKVRPMTDKERAAVPPLPGDEAQVAEGHSASCRACSSRWRRGCPPTSRRGGGRP